MHIAIECRCGNTYSVDENPVNGHLCFPVSCPHCHADGTELANNFIRQAERGESAEASPKQSPVSFRFGLGVLGALVGGAAGMMVWYLVTRWTGYEIGYVAWGVGGLAGLGARFAMRGGSFGLAGVASFAAFLAIMGGQYLCLRDGLELNLKSAEAVAYEDMTKYALEAVQATNDIQVRRLVEAHGFYASDLAPGESAAVCKKRLLPMFGFLFRGVMKEGSAPTLKERIEEVRARSEPTEADLAAFGSRELPDLKAFLKGNPSREEFCRDLEHLVRDNLSFNGMLVQSWSPYQLLWLLLGVGTAYRLAYNRSETEDI